MYGDGQISSQEKSDRDGAVGRLTAPRPLGLAVADWLVLLLGSLLVAGLLLLGT